MDLKLGMGLLPISKLLNRVGELVRNVVSRMKITSYLLFYDLAIYQFYPFLSLRILEIVENGSIK